MRLARIIEKADEAEGSWELYAEGEGDEAGEKIEFYIVPIPPGEELRIESKYLGRDRKYTLTEDGQQLSHNIERTAGYHRERALHALADCRTNVYVTIEGKTAAEKTSAELGEKVESGQQVVFDGRVRGLEQPARGFKELLFRHHAAAAIWISQRATRLRVTAAKEEEGKGAS